MTYDVAAYIWPAYSGDDMRSRVFWAEGYGEWQSLKNSKPKFKGHQWPRKPLWGYVNEGDPYVMEMEIEAAADHGVNVFLYDWYWYDERPFLENCLNDGFLKARNNKKMRFYLMWANHDARYNWDIRNCNMPGDNPIWKGTVNERQFVYLSDRIIDKYFGEPNYYKIDGCPVFSVYDPWSLIYSFGSVDGARKAVDGFRERCVKAGLPGLHYQLIARAEMTYDLREYGGVFSQRDLMTALCADSVTNYGNGCYTGTNIDYADSYPIIEKYHQIMDGYPMPYFPSVSMGWDNNPRYDAGTLCPDIIKNSNPENFRKALELMKKYADSHPGQPPLVIINAWNEWTEANYLQPDDLYGYGMLDAVKDVFCAGES